jgi:DNA-directed RNA polymerase subunit beta'
MNEENLLISKQKTGTKSNSSLEIKKKRIFGCTNSASKKTLISTNSKKFILNSTKENDFLNSKDSDYQINIENKSSVIKNTTSFGKNSQLDKISFNQFEPKPFVKTFSKEKKILQKNEILQEFKFQQVSKQKKQKESESKIKINQNQELNNFNQENLTNKDLEIPTVLYELDDLMKNLKDVHTSFDYIRISLVSPLRLKIWTERYLEFPQGERQIIGEVDLAETFHYKTMKPETGGLFCQVIFGPVRTGVCACGTFRSLQQIGIHCLKCRVEITHARVRRYRMGSISLARPVVHFWYLTASPNYLCILLNSFGNYDRPRQLLQTLDLHNFVYPKPNRRYPPTFLYRLIREWKIWKGKEDKMDSHCLIYGVPFPFKTKEVEEDELLKIDPAEVLKFALNQIGGSAEKLKETLSKERSYFRPKANVWNKKVISLREQMRMRRIRLLESFLATETNPAWMIIDMVAVLPPSLRPLVQINPRLIVSSDLNELYRMVLYKNETLSTSLSVFCPPLIQSSCRLSLQVSVDQLFDNERTDNPILMDLNNRPYLELMDLPFRSLTYRLEGKEGRFRHNLLGKRVDYSARSVIVVGPTLRLNECGLPYAIVRELFSPLLIYWFENEVVNRYGGSAISLAKFMALDARRDVFRCNQLILWRLLTKLTREYCVLLNRAPTLHRFGIQAFHPVLTLDQAIHLHPLVCNGFNADFDGDQMAVYLPFYHVSQWEARAMMRPSGNILSPANGEVVLKPSQDMVIGCYYLTLRIYREQQKRHFPFLFSSERTALLSYWNKQIELHTLIWVRYHVARFDCRINKQGLIWFDPSMYLRNNKDKIQIDRIVPFRRKYALFTSLGILIVAKSQKKIQTKFFLEKNQTKHKWKHWTEESDKTQFSEFWQNYTVTDWFHETTPGRLLFVTSVKFAL